MQLPEPDPSLCRDLAADLAAARYTAPRVRALWGEAADAAFGRGRILPALRAIGADGSAVAVLARLWGLGRSVPVGDAARALPTVGIEGAVALGLAARDDDVVRATALVRPQDVSDDRGEAGWWIASDLDEAALGGPLPVDHVLGVGGASTTLALLQFSSPVRRVLDLGAGCGIQALRARRSCAEVVATDVSERALRFTRLNALLNSVDGIRTARGDVFGAVPDERFERIVSNPPFVITPRRAGVTAYEYRDAGRVGDALVAEVVGGIAAHLVPGGTAQLLGNWESRGDVDGLARVRAWVEASEPPLDAWVIERESLDPLAYAELWIRDGGTLPGTPAYDDLLAAWLDDFDAREVTAIGFGYIVLRRPLDGAATLRRFETLTHPLPESGIGAHLERAIAAHDRLATLDADALDRTVLIVAPDVTEVRHHRPGAADPAVIELRQGGGLARTVAVDPGLAALVGACDGDLAVGPLIAAIAELLEVDPAALRAELHRGVRELVTTGFLDVAEPHAPAAGAGRRG